MSFTNPSAHSTIDGACGRSGRAEPILNKCICQVVNCIQIIGNYTHTNGNLRLPYSIEAIHDHISWPYQNPTDFVMISLVTSVTQRQKNAWTLLTTSLFGMAASRQAVPVDSASGRVFVDFLEHRFIRSGNGRLYP